MSGTGGGEEVVKGRGCTRPLPLSALFHSPDGEAGPEGGRGGAETVKGGGCRSSTQEEERREREGRRKDIGIGK